MIYGIDSFCNRFHSVRVDQRNGNSATSIRDVARRANVSPATVSRAFAEPGLVRHETLQRVLAVAEELRYRPSRAARSLTTGKTGNIGVVVPDLGNPFFPAILKGAQARAREADHAVFLADSEENPRLEMELVRAMARQVDGVVICSSRLSEAQLQQLRRDTTLVLLNRRIRGVSAVLLDSAGGMRQAIEHLVALGHERIGFLGGPAESWSNRERRRGLRAEARRRLLDVIEFGPFAPHFEAGQHAADLAVAADVTAVIAFNDLMALGVLSRLADRGIGVPNEISVVGFDNILMAGMSNPQLTTVALPLEQAGRVAIELLLEQLAQPGTGTHEQGLPAQLIVRASTAPPRSGVRSGLRAMRTEPLQETTAIAESK
jgi:DNA-binding LacI/PurR family transcriptional regulator